MAKVPCNVVGVAGILKIIAVASVAIPGKATDLIVLVATGTGCPAMGSIQSKTTALQMIKLGIVPGNLIMT